MQQFIEQLDAAGLMSVDDVQAVLAGVRNEERPRKAEELARWLVQQKRLTPFQAQQVYAGRGQSLTLGNYRILDKLGEGGMGMVLKAEHRRMKRIVALKVLSRKVIRYPDSRVRFQREVLAAARLEHPNIVTAYDADEAHGTVFLVMQFVDGQDLSSLVRSGGPLPISEAVECVVQAAKGLQYAHKRGVIHRDIKPSNLLLDADGAVKILDMGLARVDDPNGEQSALTTSGMLLGTIDYMAPEQAVDTRNADARSDIYSLGATFWFLMTGRPLYFGESQVTRLLAHRESPCPSLVDCLGNHPAASGLSLEALDAVLQKMIAKQPADRYQSMAEVITALQGLRHGDARTPHVSTSAGSDDSRLNEFLAGLSIASDNSGRSQTLRPSGLPALPPSHPMMATSYTDEATVPQAKAPQAIPRPVVALQRVAEASRRPWWQHLHFQLATAVALALLIALPIAWLKWSPTLTAAVAAGQSAARGPTEQPVADADQFTVVPVVGRQTANLQFATTSAPPATEILTSPDWEWVSQPEMLAAVNTPAKEAHPTLSADGRVLVFYSNREGRPQLWEAQRTGIDQPFEAPVPLSVPALDEFERFWDPCLSADGKQLFFILKPAGTADTPKLAVLQRSHCDAPWGHVTFVSDSLNLELPPWRSRLSADGLDLLFHHDSSDDPGQLDLWMCSRQRGDEPFGIPLRLAAPISSTVEEQPFAISCDGLAIMFLRNQPPVQLWLATRESRDGNFASVRHLHLPCELIYPSPAGLTADSRTLIVAVNPEQPDLLQLQRMPKAASASE